MKTTRFDVHCNQQNLLAESKCFLQSKNLNCSRCHNPHQNARSDLKVYSQHCMGCHNEAGNNFCTVKQVAGISLKDNCINCHMPKKTSAAISFYQLGIVFYHPVCRVGWPELALSTTIKK